MMGTVLPFSRPRRPSPLPPDAPALIDVDAVIADVEALLSMSADRLARMRAGSPERERELDSWLGFLAELVELHRMRARILQPGLRLVEGGQRG